MSYKSPSSKYPAAIKNVMLKDIMNSVRFRQILDDIKISGDQYLVKENNEALAVLLPMGDWELLKQARDRKDEAWEDLLQNLEEVHAMNQNASAQEIDADVDQAIQAIRHPSRV